MAIEGLGVELCEDVDFVYSTVDAIAHWDINEPVAATNRHLVIHKWKVVKCGYPQEAHYKSNRKEAPAKLI